MIVVCRVCGGNVDAWALSTQDDLQGIGMFPIYYTILTNTKLNYPNMGSGPKWAEVILELSPIEYPTEVQIW